MLTRQTSSEMIDPSRASMRWRVERVRDALLADLSQPLSLREIAALVCMSREQCVRTFSRRFGLPPCRFRMHARVHLACDLLRSGMRPTRVTFECGFADQSHLNRWFKKVVGVTPGRFVNAARDDGLSVSVPIAIGTAVGPGTASEIGTAVTAIQVASFSRA